MRRLWEGFCANYVHRPQPVPAVLKNALGRETFARFLSLSLVLPERSQPAQASLGSGEDP
jgi:hypothetical protein